MKHYLLSALLCFLTCVPLGPVAAARTIEFETTEVTRPDVALSPDGEWLIFTLLGHLFRLPVDGGDAEQLTFGPYYDTDIAISPDGNRVALVSDRDGSEGNIFVLELATGQIMQVTHESWAGRPTWTPDGQALVYLRLVREAWRWGRRWGLLALPPAQVRRVAVDGGEPETLRAALADVRSVFHLPDGRVGWAIVEPDTTVPPATTLIAPGTTTRIEVMAGDGTLSTVRTLDGVVEGVVPSPTGEGLYVRGWLGLAAARSGFQHMVAFVPLPAGLERPIVAVHRESRYNFFGGQPRFAVAADNAALYVGHRGRLWKVGLPGGEQYPIAFGAEVALEVRAPVPPPTWTIPAPGDSAPPRSIRYPRLSPDGERLVFRAAHYLWEQPLDGGPVRRLSDADAIGWNPAFSPDGRKVAFLHWSIATDQELRVFDVATGRTRTVSTGVRNRSPNWTPDGERLIVVDDPDDLSFRLVAIDLTDGTRDTLAEMEGDLSSGAGISISPDGQWLYFVARRVPGHPSVATVFRLSLHDRTARPEAVTQLALEYRRGRVSPDGQWFAFQPPSRRDIRVVPLGGERVTADDARLLSPYGNGRFAFTHDGSALIYATANRVWRHPLGGGQREEIPVRLELERPTPPPVLLRRVRVLDFVAGGFGPEASLLIQGGRIQWIGAERGRPLPSGTVIIDAAGRFAIPGLFDMHVHGGQRRAFVPYGVTSVRGMGQVMFRVVSEDADRSAFTGEPEPRYFYAGHILRSPQGNLGAAVQVYDEDDARAHVRMLKAWGAQFIKLNVDLPWPLHRAASEEARRLGLPAATHGSTVEQVVKGVTLGYGALTHIAHPFYDDVLRLLAATGTRWDPTLGFTGSGIRLILRDEPERLDDPKLQAFLSEATIRQMRRWRVGSDQILRGVWENNKRTIAAAYRHGVRLLTGTDVGTLGGVGLQWELELFAKAGIPPLDVLRFATQASAETVGAGDDLGTLEVGKLADIVLLDANPLDDIKNTQTIWRVIKGGWLFDPDELRPAASTSSARD